MNRTSNRGTDVRRSFANAAESEIAPLSPETDRAAMPGFLTGRRLLWYAVVVAICCGFTAVIAWPIFHSGKPGEHCFDFNWVWLTGKFAAANMAVEVYNPTAALPPEAAALPEFQCAGTAGDGRFDYPPTILFFTYPLGFMSYGVAMAVWVAATLLLYLAAIYAILPRAAAVFAGLTTYPVLLNALIGHNGFLTAGLFGLALALIERRPWLSGLFLGLLTYKPQFGLLFPFALLAAGNWRVFIAAAVAGITFAAAAALAFGHELWPLFLSGIGEAATKLSAAQPVSNVVFPTVRGVLQHFGVTPQIAWGTQTAVTAALLIGICVLWRQPVPHSLKAASLATAAVLATPYALSYDYCILSIAAAFLVRNGLEWGFLRGERAALIVCWAGLSSFAFVAAIIVGGFTRESGFGDRFLYLVLGVVPVLICVALLVQITRRFFTVRPRASAAAPA